MDRLTESKFGLDAVSRSSEFRLGLLARRSGLLTLASWIKHGSRNRLLIRVEQTQGEPVVIQSIHSRPTEPSVPWLMVDASGGSSIVDCPMGAYGQVVHLPSGATLRTQVAGDPVIILRRGSHPARVLIAFNGRSETIEVPAGSGIFSLTPARPEMLVSDPRPVKAPGASEFQKDFIKSFRQKGHKVVAVHTPRWLGVTHSTKVLFDACYPVPNSPDEWPGDVTEGELERHAKTIVESGARRVIFSGGDEAHYRLMEAIRRIDDTIRFDLVFHGNFTQLQDRYIWSIFTMWCEAAKEGKIREFVTLKKGADEVLRAAGVPSRHLENYVPGEVMSPPKISDGKKHVGIWFSGTIFKSANPMISALTMIPGAVLHSAGLGAQGDELASFLGVERGFASEVTIPKAELEKRIRETQLSMYVTSAECSPMLPLESLQLGVPCLIGPSSHLFEDQPYLHERLVVPYPDRPEVIAKYAARAIEEREEIVAQWAAYAPQYNAHAKELVRRFLEGA